MPTILLDSKEYGFVLNDSDFLVIRDKVVDKLATYTKKEKSWKFPAGSRFETISRLSGVKL